MFGAVLGLVFLGAEGITFHIPSPEGEVIYSGEYVPLRGVSMTDPSDPLIGTSLSWWNQLRLPWWSYPLIGAATGAVVAMALALTGSGLRAPVARGERPAKSEQCRCGDGVRVGADEGGV